MNHYEAKQEARRERLEARAAKLRKEAAARYAGASQIASFIPMGQPILVGHHSERRHRRDLERINRGYERAHEAQQAAGAAQAAADRIAAGAGGISSDDPDAPDKLDARIRELEARQERMKAANAAARKAGEPRQYEPYQLTNNGANIRRLQDRRKVLAAKAQEENSEREVAGVRVVEDADDNRLRLIFPGKPAPAVIAHLKSRGFRWSPSAGAWQRQLNNGARFAASQVLAGLDPA